MKTKTKEELIDELKQETSIGCVLYLKGHTGDFPEDNSGETNALTVFEDTEMWGGDKEYNEQRINEVFDAAIEKIVVELGRLSLTHNITGFCFDSTSKIYLTRSDDYSTNIDAELIDELIALVNRDRKSRIQFFYEPRRNELFSTFCVKCQISDDINSKLDMYDARASTRGKTNEQIHNDK